MFKKILKLLLSDLKLFTASYSNNVFPEPLTKEEEEKCIEQFLNGDKEARRKLIEHNLRLVAHIVKKYDSKIEDPAAILSIVFVPLKTSSTIARTGMLLLCAASTILFNALISTM